MASGNPEAARDRLGELWPLRDRLVAELRALREAVLRSGFNSAQEGVGRISPQVR